MKEKINDFLKNLDLKRQLGVIVFISLIISLISLVLILPNLLTPFYEKNIYEVLKEPLSFIEENKKSSSNIAYIINTNNNIYVSSNFTNYFNKEDIERGYLEVENRRGIIEQFPITAISIGVVKVTEDMCKGWGITEEELKENSRAQSAKLRIFEKE